MAATEEAAYTRPTPSLSRCPRCTRPWELTSQITHKCVYCNHRLNWKEKALREKTWVWLLEFLPYLAWIALGLIILKINGE